MVNFFQSSFAILVVEIVLGCGKRKEMEEEDVDTMKIIKIPIYM